MEMVSRREGLELDTVVDNDDGRSDTRGRRA